MLVVDASKDGIQQDQRYNRCDNILQWMEMESGLCNLTHTHTPNLEMLSHLKIVLDVSDFFTFPNSLSTFGIYQK